MKKTTKVIAEVAIGIVAVTFGILAFLLNLTPEVDTTVLPKPSITKSTAEPAVTRATLLVAINAERAKHSVAPLIEDTRLDKAAQQKCQDETTNHYYDHVSPAGIRGDTLAEKALSDAPGYYDENLAEPYPVTTKEVVSEWVNSPAHHKAMTDSHYTITGFGISGRNVCEHFYGPY